MRKRMKKLLTLVLLATMVLGNVTPAYASETETVTVSQDNIASGTVDEDYGKFTWVIDSTGKLTVTGTGDVYIPGPGSAVPWYPYRESILTAEINIAEMRDAHGLFQGCSNMTSVDLTNFDTSNLEYWGAMFQDCSALTELDLSGLDTSAAINMGSMFWGCSALTELNLSSFDTSNVTSMGDMFRECNALTELDLSGFDTSSVTGMGYMFNDCWSLEKLDLSSFDTGNVTDMQDMFSGCRSLTELDLSSFDTSNLGEGPGKGLGMYRMFDCCSSLTKIDLSSFSTSNIGNMDYLFGSCNNLTELDLSNFDMQNVVTADKMLAYSEGLEKIEVPINCSLEVELPTSGGAYQWVMPDGTVVTSLPQNLTESVTLYKNEIPYEEDVIASGVIDEEYGQITWVIDQEGRLNVTGTGDVSNTSATERMPWYSYRKDITSAEINVTGMTDASDLFFGCSNMVSVDLSNFDTSNITDMGLMFGSCENLKDIDLSDFDTRNVTNMAGMFEFCFAAESLDVSGFDTSNVTNMRCMFNGCESVKKLDISRFDTSNVTDLSVMFWGCKNITELDVSEFNTSNVTDMSYMFTGCKEVTQLDVSNFDTTQVTDMRDMFESCCKLTQLDLSNFRTERVEDMSYMFYGCLVLEKLDLSSFDMSNVTNASNMFLSCRSLVRIQTPINCTQDIELPTQSEDDKWYQPDSTVIIALPQGLNESMTLMKNEIPEVTSPEEEEPSISVTEVFADVPEGSWYIDAVQYVYDNGIMSGNGGLFTPNAEVTRAMVVETLYKMEGKPAVEDFTIYNQFIDLNQSDWWANSVAWAMNENIATGDTYYKTFSPEVSVTREQFATFLYRYAKGKNLDVTLSKDADEILAGTYVSDYAKEAFAWSVDAGLINGAQSTDANGNISYDLAPQAGATRAELATILQRFCVNYNI